MTTETLNFKIGLSGTFWNKRPAFSILLDNNLITNGSIIGEEKEIQYIEFQADITEASDHTLTIRLDNKEESDTVENTDKTAIVKDLLLNIESIEIDEISLGSILWSASEYIPDNKQFPNTKNCVNLGWNGAYNIKFSSPFYLWLLESM